MYFHPMHLPFRCEVHHCEGEACQWKPIGWFYSKNWPSQCRVWSTALMSPLRWPATTKQHILSWLFDRGTVRLSRHICSPQNFPNPQSYFCFCSAKSVSCWVHKMNNNIIDYVPELRPSVKIFDTGIAVPNDCVYAAVRGRADNRVQQLCAA